MDTRAPTVMFIAMVIGVLGYLIEVLLGKVDLRGYGRISRDVRLLGNTVHGKTSRDGEDLVVRGSIRSWPISLRFSHSDQKPELNVTMPVPSNLTLFCVPRTHSAIGQVSLQSTDPRFSARYRLSTNHPLEARIAFPSDTTLQQIEKLCSNSSSPILLALQDRTLELSKLTIPENDVYKQVLSGMHVMAQIADAAASMPSSVITKTDSGLVRHRNWFRATYSALSILLMLSYLVVEIPFRGNTVPPSPAPALLPAGIPMEEAAQIPDIQQWRLAEPTDFEIDAQSWFRQRGSTLTGRIPMSVANSAKSGVVYILKKKDEPDSRSGRVVTFVDGQQRFDLALPQLALVALIPLDVIQSIQWSGRAPVGEPDSDGILVVRRIEAPESATIFFFSGLHLLSGRPQDYQNLPLR